MVAIQHYHWMNVSYWIQATRKRCAVPFGGICNNSMFTVKRAIFLPWPLVAHLSNTCTMSVTVWCCLGTLEKWEGADDSVSDAYDGLNFPLLEQKLLPSCFVFL